MNVPHVPCLVDSSAIVIGNLNELNSIIVICLSYPAWAQVRVMAMLTLLASADPCDVACIVCMWDSHNVFLLVVLSHKLLLLLLDALPISFKIHI